VALVLYKGEHDPSRGGSVQELKAMGVG
jgi:hypothetical protein